MFIDPVFTAVGSEESVASKCITEQISNLRGTGQISNPAASKILYCKKKINTAKLRSNVKMAGCDLQNTAIIFNQITVHISLP